MAFKDEHGNIVSSKTLKKAKIVIKKQYKYIGRHYWWIDNGELFEGVAISEPNGNEVTIQGINRNINKGQPEFKGEVNISIIKEENAE